MWDVEGAWSFYCKSTDQVHEKCSGKEGVVVLSWKRKHGGLSKYFLDHSQPSGLNLRLNLFFVLIT